jgi:hypothetical protein
MSEAAIGTGPSGVSSAVDPVVAALCAVGVVTALRMRSSYGSLPSRTTTPKGRPPFSGSFETAHPASVF